MPRAVDGTYETPSNSVAPAVAATTIDPDDFNALITDMETGISDTVYTSGMTGTDNLLTRTDGTNGKKVQASPIAVDDSGNLSGIGYVDIAEIAAPGSPATNTARLYCVDSSGTTKLAYKDAAGTVTTIETSAGGSGSPSIPQGRLTLTAAMPVLTSTVSGATTVYYALYSGRYVPLYNGSAFVMTDIGGELSQATTDTTKSPAAATTNSNYDLFVWSDGGTYRCTRGPAWTSDTARGTGAGTTELERVTGIWVNKIAITNGPAAQRGTYVGTIRTNGSSTVDYILGGSSAGGTAAVIGIWNMYNRVQVTPVTRDTTSSWSITSSTPAAMNVGVGSGLGNRISMVRGLNEDGVQATLSVSFSGGAADYILGIGVDTTTTFTSGGYGSFGTNSAPGSVSWGLLPGLGFHYLQAMESRPSAGTATAFGQVTSQPTQQFSAVMRA